MAYVALYRKWRPLTFDDIIGQEHIKKSLRNAVIAERVSHAYLFCGTRGTGKTSVAKIMSRAVNCLNPKNGNPCNSCEICTGILNGSLLDVIEMDAASNNGVDDIRSITDEVMYVPAKAKYKVYIIDEVHMLSTGAFNALLKTLEEPPKHAMFILATTEPHKLPATILSRCQRFDFRRISTSNIAERIKYIVGSDGYKISDDAALYIASISQGAMRDALSLLDQCMLVADSSEITIETLISILGNVDEDYMFEFFDSIKNKNIQKCLEKIYEAYVNGKDMSQLADNIVVHARNLILTKLTSNAEGIIDVIPSVMEKFKKQSKDFNEEILTEVIKQFSELEYPLKWSSYPRVLLEVAIIKLFKKKEDDISGLARRVAELEEKLDDILSRGLCNQNSQFETSMNNINVNSSKNSVDSVSEKGVKYEALPRKNTSQNKGKKNEDENKNYRLEELKELDIFQEVLEELKDSGRMAMYLNLFETKAYELSENTIAIMYEREGCIGSVFMREKENKAYLEQFISNKLGKKINIRIMCKSSLIDESEQSNKDKKPDDDFMKRVEEISQRYNADVNIIDE